MACVVRLKRCMVLDALGMQTHPDKTFIGNGNKGFDFLGFAICPTGLTVSDAALSRRDKKIARLYEQGASKRRVGLYLARWFGWASIVVVTAVPSVTLGACTDAIAFTDASYSSCVRNLHSSDCTASGNGPHLQP